MKVEVVVQASSGVISSKCSLDVLSSDFVKDLKTKVVTSQQIGLPYADLVVKNHWDEELEEGCTLEESGVESGHTLLLIANACADSIATQIKDLLKKRELTVDEIGLLYCYKFGGSVTDALHCVGLSGNLEQFIEDRSDFVVSKGVVSIVSPAKALKPFDAADALVDILEHHGGNMSVTDLCSKFLHQFHVSLSSIVNTRPSEFLLQDPRFEILGRGKVGLRSKLPPGRCDKGQVMCKADLFKQAFEGCRQSKREKKCRAQRRKDISTHEHSNWKAGLSSGDENVDETEQMYLNLHSKVASRGFQSRISNALNSVLDHVLTYCFLNVEKSIKGGSVGNGTVVEGSIDACIVLFLSGVPSDGHVTWLAPLLRSIKTILDLNPPDGVTDVKIDDHVLSLTCDHGLRVSLMFSPFFPSYKDAIQALGNQGPEARRFFTSTFMKESVAFVQKQSSEVKVTIRLLKWWRDQQIWQCELTRPSNELLELLAIYAHKAQRPSGQQEAIANCMAILADFTNVRITWTTHYERCDVWSPLLLQRPLLMDPVNPFVNVVDPQVFDPREVMTKAACTHFFY